MKTSETSHLIYTRVAGFTFLFYIVAGITSLALASQTQVADMLSLLTSFSALVLGVTLYMITREQGLALAMLALTCRVLEPSLARPQSSSLSAARSSPGSSCAAG